ncbi:unnamed protein product [Didymodactylos carnosus]|uniref:Ubiquitin-like domain-containing protein n=1 Tax=Didymodactylos carnosus TaxID=1234261 RepID=A0A813ZDG0_9BILA|nr:unnamed protein product [Didymodactylos carnosus]CAF0896719.1 unnamed protein product [Didymodactylos carnosus]CAF3529108.1 unnamed protein product [Didymodactylos carnosus]CAF3679904.1 unnamed protein product [Didymodactylos carnosus]
MKLIEISQGTIYLFLSDDVQNDVTIANTNRSTRYNRVQGISAHQQQVLPSVKGINMLLDEGFQPFFYFKKPLISNALVYFISVDTTVCSRILNIPNLSLDTQMSHLKEKALHYLQLTEMDPAAYELHYYGRELFDNSTLNDIKTHCSANYILTLVVRKIQSTETATYNVFSATFDDVMYMNIAFVHSLRLLIYSIVVLSTSKPGDVSSFS